MTPSLQAHDLYRFYHAGDDETLALRGVSLSIDAGELVAITGPSGAGKSTLLSCLAGLDDPDGGMVLVNGHALSRRPEADRAGLRARLVGVLYQSRNLLETLTITQNVAIAQCLAGRIDRRASEELLDQLGLSHRAHNLPRTLSGGETARAGLAVALANRPAVVLADEPTGELDSATALTVMELVRMRAHEGSAVVIVTHDTAVAAHADREIRLLDGRVRSE